MPLGALTGAPAQKANAKNQQALTWLHNLGMADLDSAYHTSRGLISPAYDAARGDLEQGYGAATGAVRQGAGDALSALAGAHGTSTGRFDQARADLQGAAGAFDPLDALADQYGGAVNLYLNALGAGAPGGQQAAVDAFQAGPGYQFSLDQGLDAISRRRAAQGMNMSGNADRDATEYAMGLANQEYGGWMDRLAGFVNPQLQATSAAASGRAGIGTSLANLGVQQAGHDAQYGRDVAGVHGGQADALSRLATDYYGGLAGSRVGEAGTLADLASNYYGNRVNLRNQLGDKWMDSTNMAAQGRANAGANIMNLGLGVGNMIWGPKGKAT